MGTEHRFGKQRIPSLREIHTLPALDGAKRATDIDRRLNIRRVHRVQPPEDPDFPIFSSFPHATRLYQESTKEGNGCGAPPWRWDRAEEAGGKLLLAGRRLRKMTEHEMEDLLWAFPESLLREPLKQYQRQQSSGVSRTDLVFVDSLGRLLVIEVKKGILSRAAIRQTMDHFGSKKSQNPDKIVEPMVVANRIPQERKATLDNYQIEWREIPEQRFREVAAEKGYVFETEQKRPIEDSLLRSPVSPSANHPPATAPDLPAEWVKVVWKDDCADARRKGNAEFARYGEYLTRLTSSAESTPA